MAGTKISDLPSASTLTGAELVPVVQSDVTKKTTVNDIISFPGIGTVTSVNVLGGTTGLTTSGGPITTSGTITLAGTLDVDNGGTGATTAANARTNLDVPSRSGSGASGTWSIDVTGNAGTVTNGVYTTGSYSNPSWITALAGSKVTGNISGNAANVTGTVAVANGGTGATTASGARTNLSAAVSGANSDITSLSGITGGISTADYVDFDTVNTPASAVGRVFWDGGTTLNVGMTSNVTGKVNESLYVYIKASAAITKGQVIVQDGAVGGSGVLKAKPAPTGLTDAQTILGVAAEDIALNAFGLIQTHGYLTGLNTTGTSVGETWADGDQLYYNPAYTGGLTKVKPSAPYIKLPMGEVVNAGSGGSGSLIILIGASSQLGGTDSNVQFSTLANGQTLIYNASTARWENNTLTAGSGISVTNGAGSITIAATNSGTVTSVNVSGGSTGLTTSGGPVTSSGTISLGGTLAVGYGGTGATTAPNARINLLPSYTSNAGKVLAVNVGGTDVEWIAAGGTGTVTSVAVSGGSTGLTTSGGPITGAGTITLAGTLGVGYGGTGQTSYTDGQLLIGNSTGNTLTKSTLTAGSGISITNGSGSITIAATGGSGTVTSVDVSGGTTGLSFSGGPVTSSGTITMAGTLGIANGGTGQVTQQAAINALAGAQTSGYYLRGNGTNVSMSAIQAGDVPTLNQNTTGSAGSVANALTINNSGTGDASGSTYNGSAAKTISYNSIGASPLAGSSSLTTVGTIGSGTWQGSTIGVGYGGTGQTSYTDGQLLIGNSTGNTLTKATLTAGTGISITNGSGSITIAASGGGGSNAYAWFIS